MLLPVLFEISFIFEVSHLHGSDFFDFVIVYNKNLTIISLILKSLLGSSTSIWLLEANKSISVSGVSFFHSHVFKFSIFAEDLLKFFVSPMVGEVFNIEINSLL